MQGQEDLFCFPNHITFVGDHHKVNLVGKSPLFILGYFGKKKTFAQESTTVSHKGLVEELLEPIFLWNQYF